MAIWKFIHRYRILCIDMNLMESNKSRRFFLFIRTLSIWTSKIMRSSFIVSSICGDRGDFYSFHFIDCQVAVDDTEFGGASWIII